MTLTFGHLVQISLQGACCFMGRRVLNREQTTNTILEEVKRLFYRTDVSQVRNDIERIIGSTVQLETNKGRHKSIISKGVVSNVYPSIFTIRLGGGTSPTRHLSFSYTDVLTNTVEITLCEDTPA